MMRLLASAHPMSASYRVGAIVHTGVVSVSVSVGIFSEYAVERQ